MGFYGVASEYRESDKNVLEDSDQDGLTDEEELLYGTDPLKKDTDGDGYGDGVEIESGYNPLIAAPGDRIITLPPDTESVSAGAGGVDNSENLTAQVSEEIASMIKQTGSDQSVSMDEVNDTVNNILSNQNQAEIILPEIKREDIKIKKSPAKSLSDEKREAQIRQDILEYVTIVGFLIANNSPEQMQTKEDFLRTFTSLSDGSMAAFSAGNMEYIDGLAKQGEKVLEEVQELEVPEEMIDIHIQALQLALYATVLKDEIQSDPADPLGQISALSKVEGLLRAGEKLSLDISEKLAEHGLENMSFGI